MRVALHISGLIRRNEEGFKQIEAFLLEPNKQHQIDIYLDIWSNKISKYENSGGEWRQHRRSEMNLSDKHDINQIYNMYNPIAMCVENDEDARYFHEMASMVRNGRTEKSRPYSLLSQFYKLYCVSKLRNIREQSLGIEYDLCVRTREELKYPKEIIFDDFDVSDNKIYVENEGYPMNWISDKFAISSSETFDRYAEFYNNFLEINSIRSKNSSELATAEPYLKHWLIDMSGLNVIKDDRIGTLGRW